jgi:hypothetical protein
MSSIIGMVHISVTCLPVKNTHQFRNKPARALPGPPLCLAGVGFDAHDLSLYKFMPKAEMNLRLAEKTAADAAAAPVSAVQAGACGGGGGGGGDVVAPMDIETPTVSDTVPAATINS